MTNKDFFERWKEDYQSHSSGAWFILMERIRQMEVEGWDRDHDAEHTDGSLALAGACYATYDVRRDIAERNWPFDEEWFKPKSKLKNLIRAGAFIAAEIDRMYNHDEGEFKKAVIELMAEASKSEVSANG